MTRIAEYQLVFSNSKYDKNGIPGLITLSSIIQQLDKLYDRIVISHKENISSIPYELNGIHWFKKLDWIMCNIGCEFNIDNSKEWLFIYSTGLFFKKWNVSILVNTHECENNESKGLDLFKIKYKNDFKGVVIDKNILPNFNLVSYSGDFWKYDEMTKAFRHICSFIRQTKGM